MECENVQGAGSSGGPVASDAETVDWAGPFPPAQPDCRDVAPRRATPDGLLENLAFGLSGLLMLFGCYLLNAAAHARPDELRPLLGLAMVFNLYEGLVLGLAWFLRQRGLAASARVLWWVALLLVADTTFIYNELAIASLPVGVPVALVAEAWAC